MPANQKSTSYFKTKFNKLLPKFNNGFENSYQHDYIFKMPCASYKSGPGEFPIEKIILDPVQHMDVIGGPYDHIDSMTELQTFKESPEPTTISGEKYQDSNFRVYYDNVSLTDKGSSSSSESPSESEQGTSYSMFNQTLDPEAECNKLQQANQYFAAAQDAKYRSMALRGEYQLFDSVANGYYHIR